MVYELDSRTGTASTSRHNVYYGTGRFRGNDGSTLMKYIFLLRAVSVLVLVILAFRPVVVRPDPGLPSSWAVLLDTSKSMRISDPVKRLEKGKELASDIGRKLSRAAMFQFSDRVESVDLDGIEKLEATGEKSDFFAGLKDVFAQNDYRGAVVITDGRHVGTGDAVSAAAAIGRPLLLIGVGDRTLFKDVAVRSIQSPPFAFKNVPTSLSAAISAVGFAGQRVTVKLMEGGRLLSVQTVEIGGADVETNVTFSWVPRSLGSRVLTVEAGEYTGEVTTQNNRKDVTLDVGRDRFRVLYICGQPGFEYAFLRHQFKSDPAVELVTFVILRNAANVVSVPDSELSLIPFPTQDVLINQMASFDLVVFEEFAYQLYGLMPSVLQAIRRKVEEGGSFLLMGGPEIFGPGSGYAIPGVYDMIPVQFGASEVSALPEPAALEVKAPSHPILRLEGNAERNREIWAALPPLDDAALLPGAKPGATVLASVRSGGRDYPVLTVWKRGRGRVAALSTRTTWRWAMLSGKKDNTSFAYQQFWKNMVLWLTHSDEFKNVRVDLEGKEVRMGETQPLRVWVYDDYFKPISDVDVRIQITRPDGSQENIETHPETTGVYAAPFEARQWGETEAQAWVLRGGKRFGQDRIKFRVVESHLEEEDLRPDFALLKEMAHATGGKFVPANEFSNAVFEAFNEEVTRTVGRKILVWNSPWLLSALLILLIVEWALRKRRGLP